MPLGGLVLTMSFLRGLTSAPSAVLPYAWERIAFWFRQVLNRHASRAHRHPHAKERWGHAGIELGFFILPPHGVPPWVAPG